MFPSLPSVYKDACSQNKLCLWIFKKMERQGIFSVGLLKPHEGLTAGSSDCMFWLESAIVAKYTRFLCRICWYLSKKWKMKPPFTIITKYKSGIVRKISLTAYNRLSCLCFGDPLYIVLSGDSHPASLGETTKQRQVSVSSQSAWQTIRHKYAASSWIFTELQLPFF